jgi:hypothetical protein
LEYVEAKNSAAFKTEPPGQTVAYLNPSQQGTDPVTCDRPEHAMKLLLLLIMCTAPLAAADSVEAQIVNMEKLADEALATRNVDLADRLTIEGYIHIFPDGQIATKKAMLAALGQAASPSFIGSSRPGFACTAIPRSSRDAATPGVGHRRGGTRSGASWRREASMDS